MKTYGSLPGVLGQVSFNTSRPYYPSHMKLVIIGLQGFFPVRCLLCYATLVLIPANS